MLAFMLVFSVCACQNNNTASATTTGASSTTLPPTTTATTVVAANETTASATTSLATTAASETTPTSEINTPELAPVTLLIAFGYTNNQPREEALVADELSKYTQEQLNVTVELLPLHVSSWVSTANLMLASGEKLDLMSTLGLPFAGTVASEYLLELDDLLDAYGQGIRSALGDYIQGGVISGKTYAVPTIRDLATTNGPTFIVEYMDKYNIDFDSINDITDLTDIWTEIKAEEGSGFYPLFVGPSNTDQLYGGLWDNLNNSLGGIDYSGDPDTVVNIYKTEVFANRVQLVRSWFQAGYINPDAAISQTTFINMVTAEVRTSCAYYSQQKPGQSENQSRTSGVPLLGKALFTPIAQTSNL